MGRNNPLEHGLGIYLRCAGFGLLRSQKDQYHQVKWILLVVYMDDIVITSNDTLGISELKLNLQKKFQTKDLGPLKYFLGIEVTRSRKGIFLSQWKYVLNVLSEADILGVRLVNCPMDPNSKLLPD